MSFTKTASIAFALILISLCAGDVLVQLNVNRPLNDVNEKFVSFTIKPEDLYKALDGPNRKSMTRMAAMLGPSYIKFTGDYYFASSSPLKLRNPTKVIWKGFNRWTRAVNWTMIIPVPYSPNTWDPMHALKILNGSYLIGITDCIWQLGTDFGSSRAQSYVTELKTLDVMVESFKPYVEDWSVMGADVSAGSSAEETRRYIEMSKDLNAAFGWTQPADLLPGNSIGSYIHDKDPALKMMLSKKVPVWLTLPQRPKSRRSKTSNNSNRFITDEITDALRWAQTLGEAASTGFDAIFKKISVSDLEKPNYSFYVTALYKKVMGSRVFPARPLTIFTRSHKLYTHCANAVSGGLAFMVVNTEERPMQISVRSLGKNTGSEVWQYTLVMKHGSILLNNERISLNSSLTPQIRVKRTDHPVQLNTPSMSVSFWVLPNVNLEHCQFTEIETDEAAKDSSENASQKTFSSADRLLQQLIKESSLQHSALAMAINRKRRYATFDKRSKRFILEGQIEKAEPKKRKAGIVNIFEPILHDDKAVKKRDSEVHERRSAPLDWITKLIDRPLELPRLRRDARSAENYFGPLFATKDGKTTTSFTKKITEITKPQKKVKPIFDLSEFDEEEFFKKISEQTEPEYEYRRTPDGDVHLKHITNAEGEDIEDYLDEKSKKIIKKSPKPILRDEMKPLRLLPTEFYEALPESAFKPAAKISSIGSALNSLLFPEPFSKQALQNNKKSKASKKRDEQPSTTTEADVVGSRKDHKNSHLAEDFMSAQKDLINSFLEEYENERPASDEKEKDKEPEEHLDGDKKDFIAKKHKFLDYLADKIEHYFSSHASEEDHEGEVEAEEDIDDVDEDKQKDTETPSDDEESAPWWDPSSFNRKRVSRALKIQLPHEVWYNNMIDKDEDLTPLGAMNPEKMAMYEYQVESLTPSINEFPNTVQNSTGRMPQKLVSTVKQQVTTLMDIVTRHVHDWYKTLTNHIETTTAANAETANPSGNSVN